MLNKLSVSIQQDSSKEQRIKINRLERHETHFLLSLHDN